MNRFDFSAAPFDCLTSAEQQALEQAADIVYFAADSVIIGPGTEYPDGFIHDTTGYRLFQTYPYESLPIAGKTGTAQAAGNLPWNDTSVFGAFSLDETRPYAVVALLEPIQARYRELLADRGELASLLRKGSDKAGVVAQATLARVYANLGLVLR